MKQQASEFEAKIIELKTEKKKTAEVLKSLLVKTKTQLREKNQALSALQKKHTDLEDLLAERVKICAVLHDEATKAQHDLKKAQRESEALPTELRSTKEALSALQEKQHDDATRSEAELKQQASDFKAKITKLKTEKRKAIEALKSRLTATGSQLEERNQALAALQTTHTATTTELGSTKEALSALQTTHTATTTELGSTKEALSALQATHTATDAELKSTKDALAELQTQHTATTTELGSTKDALAALQEKDVAATNNEAVLKAKIANLEGQLGERDQALASAQISSAAAKAPVSEAQLRYKTHIKPHPVILGLVPSISVF